MLHVEACKHAHQRTIVLQPTALLAHSSLPGCGTKQGPFALLMYNDMLVIFEIKSVLVPGVLRSDVARRTVGCPKPEVVNHLTKLRTGSAFLNTTSSANLCDLCARCARFSREPFCFAQIHIQPLGSCVLGHGRVASTICPSWG